jgi:hypothetical protein
MLRRAIRRARGHFQASVANTENENEHFHSTSVHSENYPPEKFGIRVLSAKDEKLRSEIKLKKKSIGMSAIVTAFLTNKDKSTQFTSAWRHLASIYQMFEELENKSVEQEERMNTATYTYKDEGLRSLVHNLRSPDDIFHSANVIYRDLEVLAQSVPEGHDREAFLALGNALYNEMILQSISPPVFESVNGIHIDSYAKVGQALCKSEAICA